MGLCKHLVFGSLAGAITLAGGAGPAAAAPVTLTDSNSSVTIDPAAQSGVSSWTVDGVETTNQQWLWFRVGDTGPESSIDSLTLQDSKVTDANLNPGDDSLVARYAGSDFTLDLSYRLEGSQRATADLAQQVTVHNNTNQPLSFNLFDFNDFDLLGDAADSEVRLENTNTIVQSDGANGVNRTSNVRSLPPTATSSWRSAS